MIEKLEEKFAGLDVVTPIVERLALARKDNVAQMVEVQAQGVTLKEVCAPFPAVLRAVPPIRHSLLSCAPLSREKK